jgi:hypothetical protein
MIKVIIEDNLRRLIQTANAKNIKKEAVISIVPQESQYALIYDTNE